MPYRCPRGDTVFRFLSTAAAMAVLAVAAALALVLVDASAPAIARFGPAFAASRTWDPIHHEYGALPFVFGTLYTSLLAMLFAVPVGLGAALCLSEMAGYRLASTLGFAVEFLAAVPSVIYGLWGIFVLIPWLRAHVEAPFSVRLGWVPFFTGPAYGPGILAAGVVLAIMVLPTVTSIAREVFRSVPESQRDAAYALGVTRWEMIRTILWPASRMGVLGAVVLALGRALGETMAVTMVIGNAGAISPSLFSLGNTMSSVIANQFAEATDPLQVAALMEVGLLLFLITLLVHMGARWVTVRTEHRYGVAAVARGAVWNA